MTLSDSWTLHLVDGPDNVPEPLKQVFQKNTSMGATVPGCIHTDLLAAGLIDDPYVAGNELKQHWIGHTTWRYETTFFLDASLLKAEHVELVCDGLDTFATLTLNGELIGKADNMYVVHRFNIRPMLAEGDNRLAIKFAAPVPFARRQEAEQGSLPHRGGVPGRRHPYNHVRKMACNFGWDWGPEVPTSGIWRPIRIEAWDATRLASVRPRVTLPSADFAQVEVHVDLEGQTRPVVARLSGHGFDETIEGESPLTFRAASPALWWPLGHGEQPLYDLTVTLPDASQTWHRRIGLRTSRLDTSPDPKAFGNPVPDERGATMTLLVNDKPIYCKGANWIPDDCFPHRITRQRYRHRVTLACDANMNMLRVWGGDGQYRRYLGHYPRMATEFGYHGPPAWPTLARAVPADQRQTAGCAGSIWRARRSMSTSRPSQSRHGRSPSSTCRRVSATRRLPLCGSA